jgi:hypothetical protein
VHQQAIESNNITWKSTSRGEFLPHNHRYGHWFAFQKLCMSKEVMGILSLAEKELVVIGSNLKTKEVA